MIAMERLYEKNTGDALEKHLIIYQAMEWLVSTQGGDWFEHVGREYRMRRGGAFIARFLTVQHLGFVVTRSLQELISVLSALVALGRMHVLTRRN